MKKLLMALLLICLPIAALAAEVPYLQKVTRPDEPVFAGPSYDEGYAGTVREAGVYTIVEEAEDGEGSLWGRLKSGAGWIDLTHVRSEEVAALPVSASFAEEELPGEGWHTYVMEDSADTVWVAFRAYEPLTEVRFVALEVTEEGFAISETLHALPEMTAEQPLLTGVVFYGDMTTYGLHFTDSAGDKRFFAAYISGRNGMLILEEWAVTAGPDGTLTIPLPQ